MLTGDMSTATLRDIALENCARLNKPVKLEELMQAIQTLLPRRAVRSPRTWRDRRRRVFPGAPIPWAIASQAPVERRRGENIAVHRAVNPVSFPSGRARIASRLSKRT